VSWLDGLCGLPPAQVTLDPALARQVKDPRRAAADKTVYGEGSCGAPGSWRREVWWALNRAARVGAPAGRHRWRLKPPFRYGEMVVTSGRPRLPYGRSTGKNAFLTHMPHTLLFAWSKGRLEGRMVAWWCGARTAYFELADEPSSPLCPRCEMEARVRNRPGD
jgi:hypothetical protein